MLSDFLCSQWGVALVGFVCGLTYHGTWPTLGSLVAKGAVWLRRKRLPRAKVIDLMDNLGGTKP